ncbi:MAG: amidohydrolase family protein [Frankiales bacterium]|nr:amidohydrolase family protein [Frankiales bacterium]
MAEWGGLVRRLRRTSLREETIGAGAALRGRLWCGDGTTYDDGRVVVDTAGLVAAVGAATDVAVPFGCLEVEGEWLGPGVVDSHVHLAFAEMDDVLRGAVVAVRDLGAPPADAARWRASRGLRVEVAGPLLTAPGGYPSLSWGSAGFAAFVDAPDQADALVRGLASQVDVVKLALEPRGGPVPSPELCAAVVAAAHAAGRRVTCHALSLEMVERALDAGVDELAHAPTEQLPGELVDRIGAHGTAVVSTVRAFAERGGAARDNLAALLAAGAVIRYGTDLGNGGIRPGVDAAELEILAATGLGPAGALQAATEPITVGQRAGLVLLDDDPLAHPGVWRRPRAVLAGTTLLLRG